MNREELKKYINSKDFLHMINEVYHMDDLEYIETQKKRYEDVLDKAYKIYGDGDYHFISSPGRTEICGNHTDHQNGMVIAASINLDNVCVVKATKNNIATFTDDVFGVNKVDLSNLYPLEAEKGNTKSIIRGVAARLQKLGYSIGGFDAFQDVNVPVGSGLSSSACFEVLVTEIYNYFYNDCKVSDVDRAIISQWVENNYFGKPCGLMDQMAISVGGFVHIDFSNKEKPVIRKLDFNFKDYGYDMMVVNVKANHADLTDEYAAMPNEMKKVASFFKKEVLGELNKKEFYNKLYDLRDKISDDRAILRAIHFYYENDRVKAFAEAIENKNILKILDIINESGTSSFKYLQNVYVNSDSCRQPMSLALALSDDIKGDVGAHRVHGGGFAGTMLAIVKNDMTDNYISKISTLFGKDSVLKFCIRGVGTKVII